MLLLFLIMDSLYTRTCPSQAFFYLFLIFLLSRFLKKGGRAGGLDFGSHRSRYGSNIADIPARVKLFFQIKKALG